MSETHFTKSETLRRLRRSAAHLRAVNHLPANSKVEIGLRTVLHHLDYQQAVELTSSDYRGSILPEHDDLDDFRSQVEAAARPEVQQHGYVAHLYVYESMGRDGWELFSVCCYWLGDADHGPLMVTWDGTGSIPTKEVA